MLKFEALTMLFLGCGHLLCDKSLSCTNPMVFFSPMNISQLKSLKKKKKPWWYWGGDQEENSLCVLSRTLKCFEALEV